MNFIVIGHDVVGLAASTIRSKIIGIRFDHVIIGRNGFANVNSRWDFDERVSGPKQTRGSPITLHR